MVTRHNRRWKYKDESDLRLETKTELRSESYIKLLVWVSHHRSFGVFESVWMRFMFGMRAEQEKSETLFVFVVWPDEPLVYIAAAAAASSRHYPRLGPVAGSGRLARLFEPWTLRPSSSSWKLPDVKNLRLAGWAVTISDLTTWLCWPNEFTITGLLLYL